MANFLKKGIANFQKKLALILKKLALKSANRPKLAAFVEGAIAVIRFALPALIILYASNVYEKQDLASHIWIFLGSVFGIFLICHFFGILAEHTNLVKFLRDPQARTRAMIHGNWCEIYRKGEKCYFAVMRIDGESRKLDLHGFAFEAKSEELDGTWRLLEGSVSETLNQRLASMLYSFSGQASDAEDGPGSGVITFYNRDKDGPYKNINGYFSDTRQKSSIEFSGFRIDRNLFDEKGEPLSGRDIKKEICQFLETSAQARLTVNRMCREVLSPSPEGPDPHHRS